MTIVVCWVFSMVLLTWCWMTEPHHWRTPRGWYVNGVRPDGRFEMRPVLGTPERDVDDARAMVDFDDERTITGQIYCTGGATPHVDGDSVWCQR